MTFQLSKDRISSINIKDPWQKVSVTANELSSISVLDRGCERLRETKKNPGVRNLEATKTCLMQGKGPPAKAQSSAHHRLMKRQLPDSIIDTQEDMNFDLCI